MFGERLGRVLRDVKGRMGEFEFGVLAFMADEKGASKNNTYDALMGDDGLAYCSVIFDYSRSVMYIKQTKSA